jgi:hypothetical protein
LLRTIVRSKNHTRAHDHAQPVLVVPPAYAAAVTRYDTKDLVGVAEIADLLGVGTSVVHDWRRRHQDFPQPVLRLRMGLIWAWPEVRSWASKTGRLG